MLDITLLPASKRPYYKLVEKVLRCKLFKTRKTINVIEVCETLHVEAIEVINAFTWIDGVTSHNQIIISTTAGLNSIVIECNSKELENIVTKHFTDNPY